MRHRGRSRREPAKPVQPEATALNPMSTDDLHTRSATELGDLLDSRQISAVELTRAAIARIEAMDGRINAVISRRFEDALREADDADIARARGERKKLLGIPM